VTYAPVALFVYNRPTHTRQTVEALLSNFGAAQSELYVFSDAPRDLATSQAVAEVRSYIRCIAGFKSVNIIERETNFGLAHSIIEGVTRLCEQHGRAIVLEDDLVTSPHFLAFMNDALTRYEHEDRVMQVAGYMFPVNLELDEDALFLPFTSSWGWATWQRAWRHFDAKSTGIRRLVEDKNLRRAFDLYGRYGYFKMLQSQLQGKTNSWAIRWYLSVFLKSGLIICPKKSLVSNRGFDGSGINCIASSIEETDIDTAFRVSLFPKLIAVSEKYDELLQLMPAPKLNVRSLLNRLKKL